MRPLTPKQEKFAQLYVELGNASEAYRQSYAVKPNRKPERIHVDACVLLAHPKVSKRVDEIQSSLSAKHEITRERVMSELAKIAFGDLGDFVHVSEDGDVSVNFKAAAKAKALVGLSEFSQEVFWEKDGTDGVDQIRRTKFKAHDKLKALELIGKRLVMWTDRVATKEEQPGQSERPPLTVEEIEAILDRVERRIS